MAEAHAAEHADLRHIAMVELCGDGTANWSWIEMPSNFAQAGGEG
jgi:hypothetical protein